MAVASSVDASGLERRRAAVRQLRQARKAFAEGIARDLSEAVREQIKTQGGRPGVPVHGTQIGDRTGRMRRAWTPGGPGWISRTTDADGRIMQMIGVDGKVIPYLWIHEKGGTITAKRAKYLTIPMTREAAATTARNVPGIFPLWQHGKGYLVTKRPSGVLVYWYRLRRSVTIPARPFAAPGLQVFRAERWPRLAETIREKIITDWRNP